MTVYDKLDWHLDAALSAGQSEEKAFSHIGLYLGWLVRKDQTASEFIRSDWAEAIKRGEMTGSDLSGAVDGVLASDMLTAEGRAFTDYYYPIYLSDYADTFAKSGEYTVVDDKDSFARIAPVIDRRYGSWVEDGRPGGAKAEQEPQLPAELGAALEGWSASDLAAIRNQIESVAADMRAGFQTQPELGLSAPSSDRDLEQIVLAAWPGKPHFLHSRTAAEWGEPLLKRAAKRLGVDPKDVTLATAIWSGPTVIVYRVPGADASRLVDEFSMAIHLPPSGRWERAEIAGKAVSLATGNEFTVAYWVPKDDLVVHVAVTDASILESVVSRLP